MVEVCASKLMVAFYDDNPYGVARFVEEFFEGPKPQHPFTHRERIFEAMVLVFPALEPLVFPIRLLSSLSRPDKRYAPRARYAEFKRWEELRGEDPQSTLVAMDLVQNIQVGSIVREWMEKRFFSILWHSVRELDRDCPARFGQESRAKFERVSFGLFEPGWRKQHTGFVRFECASLQVLELRSVDLRLIWTI